MLDNREDNSYSNNSSLQPNNSSNFAQQFSKLIQGTLAIGTIGFIAYLIYSFTTKVDSVDAVINGSITDIRSPEDGIVNEIIEAGEKVQAKGIFAHLSNNRLHILKFQEVQYQGRLQQLEMEWQKQTASLIFNQKLYAQVSMDTEKQQPLEEAEQQARFNERKERIVEQQERIHNLQAELESAEAEQKLAEITRDRILGLYKEGAFSQSVLDNAESNLIQKQGRIKSLQAQIQSIQANKRSIQADSEGIQANINAARNNLTLDRTRSNYDPSIRQQELEAKIQEQQQELEALKSQRKTLKTELSQIQEEMRFKERFTVEAPSSGIVWKINVQRGSQVRAGDPLGQIVNCDQQWVDAFVEEDKLSRLRQGEKATITPKGNSKSFEGTIKWIRPGIDRSIKGTDAVSFLDPNQPRRAQVRITLDHPNDSSNCVIGYSAQVALQPSQIKSQKAFPDWLNSFWPQ
jgi:multidrug resistance efflux pump